MEFRFLVSIFWLQIAPVCRNGDGPWTARKRMDAWIGNGFEGHASGMHFSGVGLAVSCQDEIL